MDNRIKKMFVEIENNYIGKSNVESGGGPVG
jgi:hypothetical protein